MNLMNFILGLKELEAKEEMRDGIDEGIEEGLQRGLKRGRAEGLQRGLQKGLQKGIRTTAKNFLALGLPIEKIAQATGLSIEEIEKLSANTKALYT